MVAGSRSWCARGLNWWIRRNPLYLLSAAAMALGARWYLVTPDAAAGDVRLILLTLAVLQLYELAVSGVLILLHRRNKSPEDQPSLLLVAALFWTGPMVATVEMTARHGSAGIGFAAAAALIALVELQTVRRTVGLRLSLWSQVAASACVLLLAAAPVRLRVPHGTAGTDELALYACWWLLSGIMLLTIAALRAPARRERAATSPETMRRTVHVELAFLVMVFTASAAHLWGMNYAFFANARAFYASPVLVALAIVLYEYLGRLGIRSSVLWALCTLPPLVAIGLAADGFHPQVPVQVLPWVLRDPLLTTLLLAAAAWWFGAERGRHPRLLHLGSLALVAAAFRGIDLPAAPPAGIDGLWAIAPYSRDEAAIVGYALTAYLLAIAWLRRSRGEVLAALVIHAAAFTSVIWERTDADLMLAGLLGGWSWLAALHVLWRRPNWRAAVWPVAGLVGITCVLGVQPELRWLAASHAVGMVLVLVTIGWLWPWTRYRTVGAVVATAFLTLAIGRSLAQGTHPKAAIAVLSAFLLLAAGSALSWYKRGVLALTAGTGPEARTDAAADSASA